MAERASGLSIVMAAPEGVPYVKTGGLADVVGALAPELARLGHEVRVFLPRYRSVDTARWGLAKPIKQFDVTLGSGPRRVKLYAHAAEKRYTVYFIEQDAYFDRDPLYGTAHGDYPDNAERFAFFSISVLEALRALDVSPDIVHVHDWQTGLVPVYLKTLFAQDAHFRKTRTVFSIHNLAYQGVFPRSQLAVTGLPDQVFSVSGLEFWGQLNYLKGGLVFSDLLLTVSERYAQEILTPEFGCGLEGVLATRSRDLAGILNGIDTDIWNPAKDTFVEPRFDARSFEEKQEVKAALQRRCGLPVEKNAFLAGMITRLADQKGADLVAKILPILLARRIQMVILGTGEARYHALLEEAAKRHPDHLRVYLKFDDPLAHAIYAGSDAFLMPSRYEPCGLSQMISLGYGTLPIVRATGGLADTIVDLDQDPKRGNGFVFHEYREDAFLATVLRALTYFDERRADWVAAARRGMGLDFSWKRSASRYVERYRTVASGCAVG